MNASSSALKRSGLVPEGRVAAVFEHDQPRVGHRLDKVRAVRGRDHLVARAVTDERRHANVRQRAAVVARELVKRHRRRDDGRICVISSTIHSKSSGASGVGKIRLIKRPRTMSACAVCAISTMPIRPSRSIAPSVHPSRLRSLAASSTITTAAR